MRSHVGAVETTSFKYAAALNWGWRHSIKQCLGCKLIGMGATGIGNLVIDRGLGFG